MRQDERVAVVMPSYRVRQHILNVLDRVGDGVTKIYVVDDKCPEQSGQFVLDNCHDHRVTVLFHEVNQGVGGAVITGYKRATEEGAAVIVKVDGDGQMDPALIPEFVQPILEGRADYTKGNRFYNPEDVQTMPLLRLVGNGLLSFMTKLSSGYWDIFDPTNGFTAISARIVPHLPLHKISRRYFFESDLLFRIGTIRACVLDVPMEAVYGTEQSNMRIVQIFPEFLWGNLKNFGKRLMYSYFLRDFSIASLQLVFGTLFLLFGTVFGTQAWIRSAVTGVTASTGTIMLAALPVILGIQFLLSFIAFDAAAVPRRAIHPLLSVSPLRTRNDTTQDQPCTPQKPENDGRRSRSLGVSHEEN
jgi:glycosyltransferase involved in cell wall biosynthesis